MKFAKISAASRGSWLWTRVIPKFLAILLILLAACSAAAQTPQATPKPAATATATARPVYAAGPVFDDLAFPSGEDTLVGRLALPEGDGPFPAVIWVHGSGQSTREEAAPLMRRLLRAGFAIFSYDKRGVGDSEGTYSGVSAYQGNTVLGQLAEDAAAAAEFVAAQDHIDAQRIGLFGASQAGWIIPQAAGLSEHVAFIAMLSGPAVSVGMENYYSALTHDQDGSVTLEEIDELSEKLANFPGSGYDPREAIEALQIPSLWILGGRDASIPNRETIAILEEIKAELSKDFTIFVYPNATHSMADADSGTQEPFVDEVLLPWLWALSAD